MTATSVMKELKFQIRETFSVRKYSRVRGVFKILSNIFLENFFVKLVNSLKQMFLQKKLLLRHRCLIGSYICSNFIVFNEVGGRKVTAQTFFKYCYNSGCILRDFLTTGIVQTHANPLWKELNVATNIL